MNKSLTRLLITTLFFITTLVYFLPQVINETTIFLPTHHENLIPNQDDIIRWAETHLPQSGVLMEDGRGFVYLKVDDRYINELFPLLENSRYTKPDYFRRPKSAGAHISVFHINERSHTGKIKEIGQSVSFTITGMDIVPPKTHEYIILTVESSKLEDIRIKYGLKPLLQGHEFHITIAKRKHHVKADE